MSRSKKKKTLSQNVVNVATTGMPSPVRKYLGGRFTALLIVASVPLLLASGVVSVHSENGRPKLSFNRQRAMEVEEAAAEHIEEIRDKRQNDRPDLPGLLPRLGREEKSGFGFSAESQPAASSGTSCLIAPKRRPTSLEPTRRRLGPPTTNKSQPPDRHKVRFRTSNSCLIVVDRVWRRCMLAESWHRY